MTPNQTQMLAQVRLLLMAAGTLLAGTPYLKGVNISESIDQIMIAAGAVTILGSMGWSLYSRRAAGIVKSAEALPTTAQIITTDPAIVAQTGPKVVAPGQ
jgi:hypothetical protein